MTKRKNSGKKENSRRNFQAEESEPLGEAFKWFIEKHGLSCYGLAKEISQLGISCHHTTLLRYAKGRLKPSKAMALILVEILQQYTKAPLTVYDFWDYDSLNLLPNGKKWHLMKDWIYETGRFDCNSSHSYS